jgi:hypothetical protein
VAGGPGARRGFFLGSLAVLTTRHPIDFLYTCPELEALRYVKHGNVPHG